MSIPKSADMWDLMKSGMSQTTKKKITKEIKQDKKIKEEVNLTAKKISTATTRRSIETPLDETEALLKKKVSIGELEEYQERQEDRRHRREELKAKGLKPGETVQHKSVLAELFKDDPDKLEKMTPENIMKLSMLAGGSGGGGSGGGGNLGTLLMLMMMNQQPTQTPQNVQKSTSILDLVKALKELKSLTTEEDKKVKNEGGELNQALMIFMMERMMKQQQPQQQGINTQLELVKYLTTLLADQNKVKEDILTDKLRQLEYQVSKYDPMEEGAKMIEYMKNFKTLFGGSMTPEGLKHELDIKKLDLEEARELRRFDDDDKKMLQIGSIIEKSVDTLSETLAQPIAKGLEARIARGSKKKKYAPEEMPEDINVEDLEDYEDLEEEYARQAPTQGESEAKRRNRNRFRIVNAEEDIE